MKRPIRDHCLVSFIARCGLAVALAVIANFSALAQPSRDYQPGASPFHFATTPGALPKTVLPARTRVHFDLDPYADSFSGSVSHTIVVTEAVSRVLLHAAELTIGQVTLTGSDAVIAVTTDKPAQTITLTLPHALPVGRHEITLAFRGKLTANGYGLYFARYRLADGSEKRMLATQMEPIGAREMLPNFDEPAFRTVWEVSVTADEKIHRAVEHACGKRSRQRG